MPLEAAAAESDLRVEGLAEERRQLLEKLKEASGVPTRSAPKHEPPRHDGSQTSPEEEENQGKHTNKNERKPMHRRKTNVYLIVSSIEKVLPFLRPR